MTWSFRGTPPGAPPPAMSLAPSAAAALPSASAVASVRLARRPALAPGRLARVALASSPGARNVGTRVVVARASSADAPSWSPTPERVALGAGWVALASTAALVAPSGTTAFDAELVRGLVTAPFSGATNPIFEALFNSLGVFPAVYAAQHIPCAKDHPR